MFSRRLLPFYILASILLLAFARCPQAARAQVLKADYQFQNTLAVTTPGAPPLTNLGDNSFAKETVNGEKRVVLRFPEASGVMLSGASGVIPRETYSIVMLFRFESTTSWRRVLDFKNSVSDNGLYTKDGKLQFYPLLIGDEVVVRPNQWVQVLLTRDRQKNVCGYVDGRLQFHFVDTADDAVIGPANNLRFFRDDGPIENSAGAVARIRLYDRPLTVAWAAGGRRLVSGARIKKLFH